MEALVDLMAVFAVGVLAGLVIADSSIGVALADLGRTFAMLSPRS
jgi:hypothetical protein